MYMVTAQLKIFSKTTAFILKTKNHLLLPSFLLNLEVIVGYNFCGFLLRKWLELNNEKKI